MATEAVPQNKTAAMMPQRSVMEDASNSMDPVDVAVIDDVSKVDAMASLAAGETNRDSTDLDENSTADAITELLAQKLDNQSKLENMLAQKLQSTTKLHNIMSQEKQGSTGLENLQSQTLANQLQTHLTRAFTQVANNVFSFISFVHITGKLEFNVDSDQV